MKTPEYYKKIFTAILFAFIVHFLIKYYVFDYQNPGLTTSVEITGSKIIFTRSKHLTLIGKGKNDPLEVYKALGWMHAKDRYVQLCLMRLASQGRLTEVFPYDENNFKLDVMAKRLNFHEKSALNLDSFSNDGMAKNIIISYTQGINEYLSNNYRPFEFILLNYHPEPFLPSHVLAFMRFTTYAGLDEVCLTSEKFVIEMIRSEKMSPSFIRELYEPHLGNLTMELIDLYKSIVNVVSNIDLRSPFIPMITNSNNWVISGNLSKSGYPIMSADPHLDVSKLPNTFYEATYETDDGDSIFGITVPGVPVFLMGRNKNLSFSLTYGMLDMADYFLEKVEDEHYERDGEFLPLIKRSVMIHNENCIFYETAEGHMIERTPDVFSFDIANGIYLAARVPNKEADEEEMLKHSLLAFAGSVKEAQELVPQAFLGSNYLFADTNGNIGYQQAGSVPLRPNSNGLLPLPAWKSSNLWTGYLKDGDYMRVINPPSGFIATANNRIQDPNKPCVSSFSAFSNRVNRATYLLQSKATHSIEDMKHYQADTFSIIANNTIPRLNPWLPNHGIGKELREWDRRFLASSRPAGLWFDFWEEFVKNVVTKLLGKDYVSMPYGRSVFNKYMFYNMALVGLKSGQVDGNAIEPILEASIKNVLARYEGAVYGDYRYFFMNNMIFAGLFPAFTGMDFGPVPTNAGFEVLKVGSIDEYHGMVCTFFQTWRFVTDMSGNIFETILPGGPSGNYFSNIYAREITDFLDHKYKKWEL